MVTVHYGLRPSGEIHLGNVLAAVYASSILLDSTNPDKKFLLTINDWDGDNPTKESYKFGVPLALRQQGKDFCQDSLNAFISFLSGICKRRGIKFEVSQTSDLLKSPRASDLVKKICEKGSTIFDILESQQEGVPIFPFDENLGRYAEQAFYHDGVIHAYSKTDGGEESHFDYEIGSDTMFEMPAEVKLALKHSLLDETVDHFVLGGNYTPASIDRIKRISKLLGHDRDYVVSPVLFHKRRVMSKSRRNVLSLQECLTTHSIDDVYSTISGVLENNPKRSVIHSDELIES